MYVLMISFEQTGLESHYNDMGGKNGIGLLLYRRRLILSTWILMIASFLFSQKPTHYPGDNDPVQFTPINILVYIVIPVVWIVAWFLIRRRKTKHADPNGPKE